MLGFGVLVMFSTVNLCIQIFSPSRWYALDWYRMRTHAIHTDAIHHVVYHWIGAPSGLGRRFGASVGRRQPCRSGRLRSARKGRRRGLAGAGFRWPQGRRVAQVRTKRLLRKPVCAGTAVAAAIAIYVVAGALTSVDQRLSRRADRGWRHHWKSYPTISRVHSH